MAERQRGWVRSPRHEAVVYVIRAVREEAGLTQRELATRMGVAQSLIGRLETGERNFAVTELLALSYAVDADPHSLLEMVIRRLAKERVREDGPAT